MNLSWKHFFAPAAAFVCGALFLAACGGDDGGGGKKVSAEDWTADVCGLAIDFNGKSDSLGSDLIDLDFGKKGAKKDVLKILDELEKARSTFRKGFDKLGTPDIDSGKDVRAAFVKQFEENDKTFKDVKDKVNKLDEGSKFGDQLMKVFQDAPEPAFRKRLQTIAGNKKTADAGDIINLIDDDPECASVLFSSSSGSEPEPTKAATRETPKAASPTAVARTTPKAGASKNEKWVIGFCGAIQAYGTDVGQLTNNINFGGGSNQQIKDGLVKVFTDMQSRTVKLRDDVKNLGAPDIKDGAKVQTALVDAFTQFVNTFDQVIKDAKALDPGASSTKLQSDLSKLTDKFTQTLDSLDSTFDKLDTQYDTKELVRIAQDVPECVGII